MNLLTVLRFQFGDAAAIRTVAQNSAALPFAIGLVLLTAVARNYDQNFILETPLWLFGSLLFSFFSGSFLFAVLYDGFIKRHFDEDLRPLRGQQWRSFMGLFWMTAPVAWLYAIPVERFFDSYAAAQANITLLAIVSAWRVLLMSRVVSVVNEVRFGRAFAWVLFAAAIEVIVVVFLGGLFGGGFSKKILAGMSGMRNAPEENLLLGTLNTAWGWSWVVAIVLCFVFALWKMYEETKPLPPMVKGKASWLSLAILMIVWTLIAWPAQQEQKKFFTHTKLLKEQRYAEALAFLAKHEEHDFPASRRLEPSPFEHSVWEDLPPTVALLTTNTPLWIRQTYLSHLAATFSHHWMNYGSLTNVASMYATMEQLPESREWLRAHQGALARQTLRSRYSGGDESAEVEAAAHTNIINTLRRMGMAETNLVRLSKE